MGHKLTRDYGAEVTAGCKVRSVSEKGKTLTLGIGIESACTSTHVFAHAVVVTVAQHGYCELRSGS